MLYMIVMEGVYDHGTGGIFPTHKEAEAHARVLDADSDGYHRFRIEEIELGVPLYPGPRHGWSGRTNEPRPTRDPEFVPWANADKNQ